MFILKDVAACYPVVVLRIGQTLPRESRYPVATGYKSVTNDQNYYLTNGHYIIGIYKGNY